MMRGLVCGFLVTAAVASAADANLLRKHFDQVCESQRFMGVVSVVVEGRSVLSEACGWADIEWSAKNTTSTRFPIASITKEMTAASVLLLHEEQKFSLSDAIGKYVVDLPELWQSATIHQLLTHTSGVPIYTASSDYTQTNPDLNGVDTLGGPRKLLDLAHDRPLMYPHGEKFLYNNSGYVLLGLLIEERAGIPYERFIQERIFDVLEMTESGYDDPRTIVPQKARGYVLEGDEIQNAKVFDPRWAWAAGAVFSTLRDLNLWTDALLTGKLLDADSMERMFRVYPEAATSDATGGTAHYGYGIVVTERFGQALLFHGGGYDGFTSVAQRYPDVNLAVTVFSNLDSDSGALPSWTLGDDLAKIWLESEQ